jgi:hypothetical protein
MATGLIYRKINPVYPTVCREVLYIMELTFILLLVEGGWFLEYPKLVQDSNYQLDNIWYRIFGRTV